MTIKEAKNIYCLGIGGIGVSAIARLCVAMGKNVSGSDIRESEVTKSLKNTKIKVIIGQGVKNLNPRPDLVIYSSDVSEASPGFVEMQEIDHLKIPRLSQAEALGQLMEDKYGIGVTGTNGKSTTTAMLGLILEAADLDPTVLIGSILSSHNESAKFQANARLGDGKFFVAESDEYARKMLKNHPQMIVITNIAEDHLDVYKNIADIKQAFGEYVASLPTEGIVIYNADDKNAVDVCRSAHCHKFTFGIHHYGDLQAINLKTENGKQKFDVHYDDEKIGEIELAVPGSFNVSNALAASLVAIKLGVKFEIVRKVLANYRGIWRRFEIVGEVESKTIITDYAHHPAGVAGTIQAAKEFYPGKKILVVFQPHHRNRTKALFPDFVESLLGADNEVIVPEIFDVTGREHGEQISSADIVTELISKGGKGTYAKNLQETEKIIRSKLPQYDIILLMGAGDIDNLAREMART